MDIEDMKRERFGKKRRISIVVTQEERDFIIDNDLSPTKILKTALLQLKLKKEEE